MVAFGSPWPSLCTAAKRPPPGRECARRGPRSHPPAKPRGQDHARHRRPGARRRAPAPSPASSRTRAGPCVATAGPTARHGGAHSPAPARTGCTWRDRRPRIRPERVPQGVTHVVIGDAMLTGAHQHGHQRSGLRDPDPAGPAELSLADPTAATATPSAPARSSCPGPAPVSCASKSTRQPPGREAQRVHVRPHHRQAAAKELLPRRGQHAGHRVLFLVPGWPARRHTGGSADRTSAPGHLREIIGPGQVRPVPAPARGRGCGRGIGGGLPG
jgi:hypothetical protein